MPKCENKNNNLILIKASLGYIDFNPQLDMTPRLLLQQITIFSISPRVNGPGWMLLAGLCT